MDAPQYVPDVVLPLLDDVLHGGVLAQGPPPIALNRPELLKLLFVAVVDVVDLFFVDKTLDALVHLLFVGPKVKWHVVFLANVRAFNNALPVLLSDRVNLESLQSR